MPLDPIELVGGLAIGTGLGGAISDTVTPRLQNFKNSQWSAHTDVPLAALAAAQVAAEDVAQYGAMESEASFTGYDSKRFANLYGVTLNAPGMGELLTMLRRQTINGGNFTHGLRKARLEPMWDDALADLRHVYIGIGDIATAIVRGAVPAPSWVPVAPPTHTDAVPRFPVTNIDPIALAAKLGYSEDMLRIMTARSGLSLAPILATQANFRGVLSDNDWLLAIAEGDLRTEWADTLREAARQIPTATAFAEHHLRGYTDAAGMYAGTKRHGMSRPDTDVLYLNMGRPVAVHQVTTGLARGGVYPSLYTDVPEPFRDAIRESDIKEPWASIAYHNRYTYPSAFVLRTLAQAGEIGDTAAVEQVLLEIGWKPEFAAKVAAAWTPAGAAADPHVTKAQNQLWAQAHKSFIQGETPQADITGALGALGISAPAQAQIVTLWTVEQGLIRKQLTAANIRKALNLGADNPATGAPWTQADAMARLLELGYDQADATVFLEL